MWIYWRFVLITCARYLWRTARGGERCDETLGRDALLAQSTQVYYCDIVSSLACFVSCVHCVHERISLSRLPSQLSSRLCPIIYGHTHTHTHSTATHVIIIYSRHKGTNTPQTCTPSQMMRPRCIRDDTLSVDVHKCVSSRARRWRSIHG